MNKLLKTIIRLYDWRIITGFLILLIICNISYFQFIPDLFEFKEIESPETLLIALWSVVVGSSSIILTILLVVYSSFSKKIKRNSLDFILDNLWIKIIFSLFAGAIIFISLSFVCIQKFENNTITLLYLSSIITVFNILIQFPLVVLSLKYSNSHARIKRLVNSITEDDIKELISPSINSNKDEFIENIERNKIVLLKDIGGHAIKENDWGLPQNILNDLYCILIKPLSKTNSISELKNNLSVFCFVCNHFKNIIIAESDYITTKVLLNLLAKAHGHLAKSEIRTLRNNPIDECIKDFHRLIIDNNNFYNIQHYLLRDSISIIKAQFESVRYTDEELPTIEYNLDNRKKGIERKEKSEELRDFWFYITHELPELLFNDLEHAIEIENKNVYSYFQWKVHSLFDIIYNSKNLTEYQKNDAFDHSFYKARTICDLAIKKNIYENIDIVSNVQIENWLIKDRKKAFSALTYFGDLLKKLNREQNLSEYYIDELFIIARKLSGQQMNPQVKQKTVRYIITTGFSIYNANGTSEKIKAELINQFKWINDYLKENDDLLDLRSNYSDEIDKM